MALVQQRMTEASEQGGAPQEDEKNSLEKLSVIETYEVDEALKLVGRERTAEFSEEYNRKLRRKLVRTLRCIRIVLTLVSGLPHSATVRRCVFHAVFVSAQLTPPYHALTTLTRDKTALNYAR